MKSKRIFIIADTLTTGKIECRMATVTPKGEAIVGSGVRKVTLQPGQFGTSWKDALSKAEEARADRCAELRSELNHLNSTTVQRVGG